MTPEQKQKTKEIHKTLLVQCTTLEDLCKKVEEEFENQEEEDWDPVPDILQEALNLLYNCCYKLEDITNS